MTQRYLKLNMSKIKMNFPHQIYPYFSLLLMSKSYHHQSSFQSQKNGFLRNPHLLYSICNHFYYTSRNIKFFSTSLYTFSIETHNFHLDYCNNFLTYLPVSFMTSRNPQLPSSHKNLLPILKMYYVTFLLKTFQSF